MPEGENAEFVNLNSDAPAPSEAVELSAEQEAAIDNAYNEFLGKVPESDSDILDKYESEEPVAPKVSDAEKARQRRVKAEQKEELVEDGLEAEEGSDKDEEDETPEEPKVEAEVEQDSPAPADLDPTLRYFAETELGWTTEKIDRLVKADPELAAETITKLADTYSNLSRQMLDSNGTQVAPGSQAPETTPAQSVSPTSKLEAFFSAKMKDAAAVEAFAAVNGEELTEFMTAFKDEILPNLREQFAEVAARKVELTKAEAQSTFGTLSEKFADTYGTAEKRTPEQWKNVSELGRLADELRTVSKLRGKELSIKEALNRAHMFVHKNATEQTVRNNIKGQIQKRSKSLTARPTNRINPRVGGVKSREAAMEAIGRVAADRGLSFFDED